MIGGDSGVFFVLVRGGVVGLWVRDVFGSKKDTSDVPFDLLRFSTFVCLVGLCCETDRIELISVV